MERIHINKMPLYKDHDKSVGNPIVGRLSGFRLSHMVSYLEFETINERGQVRRDKTKKAVLRALCDRYPKVWPGIEDIAAKAGCSTAQARRALRELEHHDKLIVDVNSRITWRKPTAQEIKNGRPVHKLVRECDDAGKKGGRGPNCTPQYHICDRKIYDIYQQQESHKREERKNARAKTQSSETENPIIQDAFPESETHSSQNETQSSQDKTQSSENSNPIIPDQNPIMVIAEPVMSCNQSKEPIRGTGQATDDAYCGGESVEKKLQTQPQPQKQPQSQTQPPFSLLPDMTGKRFEGIECLHYEDVVHLVSDGQFTVTVLTTYDARQELAGACCEAIRQMRNQPFLGRVTCAEIMDRAMVFLRMRHGIDAPKGWLPVLKKLRAEGGPTTVELPKLEFEMTTIEPPEPAEVLTSWQSALNQYQDQLQPFNDLLVEVARYKGVPGTWEDAVPFLECALDSGDVSHEELAPLIAVRDEIKSRIPGPGLFGWASSAASA